MVEKEFIKVIRFKLVYSKFYTSFVFLGSKFQKRTSKIYKEYVEFITRENLISYRRLKGRFRP